MTMFPTLFPTWRRRTPIVRETPFDVMFRDWLDEGGWPEEFEGKLMPKANVAETDKEFLVTMELPGLEEKDVEVRLTGNHLVVAGERKETVKDEDKEAHYHRVETTYGKFERRFALPAEVRKDAEAVVATFAKGMLEIRLPKVEPRKPVKIPVKEG
mgnify:CR=1